MYNPIRDFTLLYFVQPQPCLTALWYKINRPCSHGWCGAKHTTSVISRLSEVEPKIRALSHGWGCTMHTSERGVIVAGVIQSTESVSSWPGYTNNTSITSWPGLRKTHNKRFLSSLMGLYKKNKRVGTSVWGCTIQTSIKSRLGLFKAYERCAIAARIVQRMEDGVVVVGVVLYKIVERQFTAGVDEAHKWRPHRRGCTIQTSVRSRLGCGTKSSSERVVRGGVVQNTRASSHGWGCTTHTSVVPSRLGLYKANKCVVVAGVTRRTILKSWLGLYKAHKHEVMAGVVHNTRAFGHGWGWLYKTRRPWSHS